ncbi:MAG: DUF2169 domain-containing protein [Sneathiellaceae bacterium]
MLIRKPTKQAIAYRFFEHRRRPYLSLCSLFFFPFDRPRDIETEQEMWPYAAGKLAPLALEEGLPKGAAEVLLVGDCYAPGGKPARECQVGLRIGAVDKKLRVSGPRTWRRRWDNLYQAGAPEPFDAVPVSWATAFGGPGYAANPLGRGFVPDDLAAEGAGLPLVEYPGDPVVDPDSRPRPAGFAPMPQDWPQRIRRAGSYDAAYQKSGQFPGLAADIDFKAFNLAPADQWQKDWFAGDERFLIENMHPDRPRLQGRLPEIRARCFLRRRDGKGGIRFQEVPQNLDTVWLFPGDLRGIVAFRGSAELATPLGDDILHILFAYERLGSAPRSLAHYEAELDRRVDPEASAALLTYDTGLKPEDEGDPPPDPRLVVKLKDFRKDPAPAIAALMAAQAGVVAAAAKDAGVAMNAVKAAAAAGNQMPPEVAALENMVLDFNRPELIDGKAVQAQVDAATAALKAKGDAAFATQLAQREELIAEARSVAAANGQDYDAFTRTMGEKANRSASEIWAEGKAKYFEANKPFESYGEEYQDFFAKLKVEADKVDPQMAALDATRREGERAMGHVLPLPAAPSPQQAALARSALEEAMAKGEPLNSQSLAGLDLSGMDFSNRDLREADFRGANLRNADFRKSDLTKASFAQADIAGANFSDTNLTEANLARTSAARTLFVNADLTDANCGGMAGPQASFARAKLQRTALAKAGLPKAGFEGAALEDVVMMEGDLTGARLTGAGLKQVTFSGVPLVGADFTGAGLTAVMVQNASLEGAVFDDAKLDQFGVQGEGATLKGTHFARATISSSSLAGLDLTRADFTGALLDKVDLTGAVMDATRFDAAVARGAVFAKARISRSSFAGGNFANSVWVDARVSRTSFAGSVLYGSNFLHAALDENDFSEANLARSTLAGFS